MYTSNTTCLTWTSGYVSQTTVMAIWRQSKFHPSLCLLYTVLRCKHANTISSAASFALLTRIAQKTDYTLQMFQIRNDSRSGGTVGPMLSSAMGVRAIDAGIAQLSMHSCKSWIFFSPFFLFLIVSLVNSILHPHPSIPLVHSVSTILTGSGKMGFSFSPLLIWVMMVL